MDFGFPPIPIFDLLPSPAETHFDHECLYIPISVGAVKGGGGGLGTSMDWT